MCTEACENAEGSGREDEWQGSPRREGMLGGAAGRADHAGQRPLGII